MSTRVNTRAAKTVCWGASESGIADAHGTKTHWSLTSAPKNADDAGQHFGGVSLDAVDFGMSVRLRRKAACNIPGNVRSST